MKTDGGSCDVACHGPAESAGRIRCGMTLVEVVVALVLAATLLVGMLTTFRVHHRQIVRSAAMREAMRAAEPLLAHWMITAIPRAAEGTIGAREGQWRWRTRPVKRHRLAEGVAVETIRFEVAPRGAPTRRPILVLELLRPLETSDAPPLRIPSP